MVSFIHYAYACCRIAGAFLTASKAMQDDEEMAKCAKTCRAHALKTAAQWLSGLCGQDAYELFGGVER